MKTQQAILKLLTSVDSQLLGFARETNIDLWKQHKINPHRGFNIPDLVFTDDFPDVINSVVESFLVGGQNMVHYVQHPGNPRPLPRPLKTLTNLWSRSSSTLTDLLGSLIRLPSSYRNFISIFDNLSPHSYQLRAIRVNRILN